MSWRSCHKGGDFHGDQYSVIVPIDERLGMDKTLRKFKRLCESCGIVREYRKRQDYKKPSVQKRKN